MRMQILEGRQEWRDRQRIRDRNLSQAWAGWLGTIEWEFFITLTFDPKKAGNADAKLASKEAFWFCTQAACLLRRPLGWLYAVERGRSGAWHAHVLLIGVPGRELGEAIPAMWTQRNGMIDVQEAYFGRGATRYTTKVAAAGGEIVFSDTLPLFLWAKKA